MQTLFPLTFTDALSDARDYVTLFGFDVAVDVGWYVQLRMPDNDSIQLAFVDADHDSVPEALRGPPAGVAVTVELDDVAAVHARAIELGLPIRTELRDEEWGQRHFHTQDPAGLLVDVVQPIPPSPDFLARYGSGDTTPAGA